LLPGDSFDVQSLTHLTDVAAVYAAAATTAAAAAAAAAATSGLA
jgi:hypothetical protein